MKPPQGSDGAGNKAKKPNTCDGVGSDDVNPEEDPNTAELGVAVSEVRIGHRRIEVESQIQPAIILVRIASTHYGQRYRLMRKGGLTAVGWLSVARLTIPQI